MLAELKSKIFDELAQLRHELKNELPKIIETAREHGDLKENAEYHAAKERQSYVEARMGHLANRLSFLNQVNVDNIPQDQVGIGSKVTIFDLDDKDEETVELVIASEDMAEDQVTIGSPFGRALQGKKEGEIVVIKLPRGERRVRISKLLTIHQLGDENQ